MYYRTRAGRGREGDYGTFRRSEVRHLLLLLLLSALLCLVVLSLFVAITSTITIIVVMFIMISINRIIDIVGVPWRGVSFGMLSQG